MKRIIAALFIASLMIGAAAPVAEAAIDTYQYSYWGDAVPSPNAYKMEQVIYGDEWSNGRLASPMDMFVGKDERIYIADTGNNRIVILNKEFEEEQVIANFDNSGKQDALSKPEGVFGTEDGLIYVADTLNRRLVVFDTAGEFVRTIGEPKSTLLRPGFQYAPIKVAVDKAKRILVVSRGSYEGMMEFDDEGQFIGFIGTNRVKFSPIDLFWKRISTKAQREQMEQFIPLEFNNLDLDADGFIYTSTSEENSNRPIKRLNPSGADILRSKGYFPPKGDIGTLKTGSNPGSSIFVDVAADQAGIFSGLDSKRGRIFTYDKDGNLLYVFGGLGSKQDNFRTPSAIEIMDDRILVLDKDNGRLTVFEPTRYGSLIREAVISLYHGKTDQSTAAWEKVLQLNGNVEVAYLGIGKSMLKKGDYHEAMTYFKLGSNREYYSEAFKGYRKGIVLEHFGSIVLVIALAVVFCLAIMKWNRRKVKGQHFQEFGIIKNPFYTMTHPFNGFWEMKYEQKGRLKLAFGIVFLLVIFTIIKRQYSGFVVNFNNPNQLNSLNELTFIVLPFVLWCVANWSLTTLMDGEGKFKEIVMATAYAMMPFVIIYLPQTLYSNLITGSESSFYYLLDAVALIWSAWLLFTGTMTVHQYSAGKTVVTMLLTLVVIGIIIFIGVLLFSMLQQMISFAISVYKEISFRL
jgi:hypothetical protein